MSLPNLWQLYNLRASPFFQSTLGANSEQYPLSLFVARAMETRQLLSTIGGSRSSRQAVAGAAGVGKTTFVQAVKGEALTAGYWTTDDVVALYPGDTLESVIGRLLAAVYDAVVTSRPQASASALDAASQMVRAIRIHGGGGNLSVLGVGVGISRSESAVTPPGALLLDGPRVLRDLLAFARDAGAPGVIVHVNNLENLGERDAQAAAELLRGIRDTILLLDGLHLILVGTTDAIITMVNRYAQVRSVFSSPLVLEWLTVPEVEELLALRYRHLSMDADRRGAAPIDADTVRALYPLFRGDLRALLKSLEDGVTALLGVARTTPPSPIMFDELRPVLQRRGELQLRAVVGDTRFQNLVAWAQVNPAGQQTQASLGELWGLTQGTVSAALKAMVEAGCAEALPRRAGEPVAYVLGGVSRLVFG